MTGGIHFPVTVVIESSLNFNVPKCLGKCVFNFEFIIEIIIIETALTIMQTSPI